MSNVSRVKTKDRTLTDTIFESPVDRYQLRSRRRNLIILLIIVVAILAIRRWLF